jgi:hypothetical protein
MGRSSRGPSGAADGRTPVRTAHAGSPWRSLARAAVALCLLFMAVSVPGPAPAALEPAATPVVRFEAASDGATVQVRWAFPAGPVVGFNVLRSLKPDGPYVPINPWLITARADGIYAFSDLGVDPGATYHYRLEAVDEGGHKYVRGPLRIAVMPEEYTALDIPGGGGHSADPPVGATTRAGCVAAPGGRWPDAAVLLVLVALPLLRWGLRAGRFPSRRPMR